MEHQDKISVLEDELLNVHWRAKKAIFMLQDLIDGFFNYCDDIQDERGIARICSEYGRAYAKVEIAKEQLDEVDDVLRRMLENNT